MKKTKEIPANVLQATDSDTAERVYGSVFGLRDRRRIYDSVIGTISQTQKLIEKANELEPMRDARFIKNTAGRQMTYCIDILIATLGYKETAETDADGRKVPKLISEDRKTILDKSEFVETAKLLPTDKDLRNSVWKTAVHANKMRRTDKYVLKNS